MSVEITPAGIPDRLAGQMAELRKAARHAMRQATAIAAGELRQLAPGRIAENINERVGGGPGLVTGTVAPARDWREIAKWVDEGTGAYVEFHEPIRPTAGRLDANPRAALRIAPGVFRRQVKGQRPQRFIERASEMAEGRVVAVLEQPAIDVPNLLHG